MFNFNWFQRNGRLRVCWGQRIVIGPDTHFFAASIFFLTVGWLLFVLYTNVIQTVRVLAFIFGAASLSLLLATGLYNPGICPRHNYICTTQNLQLQQNNLMQVQSRKQRQRNVLVSSNTLTTQTPLGIHSDDTIAPKIEHFTVSNGQTPNLINYNKPINLDQHNKIFNRKVLNDQANNNQHTSINALQGAHKNQLQIIDKSNDDDPIAYSPGGQNKLNRQNWTSMNVINSTTNNSKLYQFATSSLLLPSNRQYQANNDNMRCKDQMFQGVRCIQTYVNNNNMANKCNSLLSTTNSNSTQTNVDANINYQGASASAITTFASNNNNNNRIGDKSNQKIISNNYNRESKTSTVNESGRRSSVHTGHGNSRWWRVVFRTWNGTLQHASVQQRWCYSCNNYRPLRAVHCRFCDVCIHRWDHHCPWTGTCIGGGNYVLYFALLWVLLLFLLIAFFGGVVSLASRIVKLKQVHSADYSMSYTYFVVNGMLQTYLIELVLILLSLIWLTLVGTLACYHTYLITKNLTSSEDAKRLTENIYNQGSCWRNIQHSLCYKEQNDDLLSRNTATCVRLSPSSTPPTYALQPPQSAHSTTVNSNNDVNANDYTTDTIVV